MAIQNMSGKAVHICRFVVKNEGVEFFKRWYDEKHFLYAIKELKCTSAALFECKKGKRDYYVNDLNDDEVTVLFSMYAWDSEEELVKGMSDADLAGLIEECQEIYPYVVANTNEDGILQMFYGKDL